MATILIIVLFFTCAGKCHAGYLQLLTKFEFGNSKIIPSYQYSELDDVTIKGNIRLPLGNVLHTRISGDLDVETPVDVHLRMGIGSEVLDSMATFYLHERCNVTPGVGARGAVTTLALDAPSVFWSTQYGVITLADAFAIVNLLGRISGEQSATMILNFTFVPEPTDFKLVTIGLLSLCFRKKRVRV